MEYAYWEIWYISCEGNRRHFRARTPIEWSSYEVRKAITMGGYGDDPAEIISIEESYEDSYDSDYE